METGKKGIYIIESLIISYIVTGIILCILAFFMYQMKSGMKIANIGITLTYIIACILAGGIAGKKMGKRKFLWGMAAGFFYFLILIGISFWLHPGEALVSAEKITTLLLCSAGGMLGGMLA